MVGAFDYALWHGEMPLPDYLAQCSTGNPLVEGRGVRVRDTAGRWLLDGRSGLWNVTLGYGEQRITRAMSRQLEVLPFATILGYEHPSAVAIEYADALAARLPRRYAKIRFGCTGAEAVESALLLSRYVRRATGQPERNIVVSLDQGYHGFGGLASVLTGTDVWYGPLSPNVIRVQPPYCHRCPWGLRLPDCALHCADQVVAAIERVGPDNVTALMVEPILGGPGLVPPDGYLQRLARYCAGAGVHFVLDETTTGFGRVGALTRAEQVGVEPDMLILGKGITSGYAPLSAIAVSSEIYQQLCDSPIDYPFLHGSTSDAHPVAMAGALAVLDIIDTDRIMDNVLARGATLAQGLRRLASAHPEVTEVRGHGLLQALELSNPDGSGWAFEQVTALRLACQERGVLISTGRNSVEIAPPLILTDGDCAEIVAAIDDALTHLASAGPVRAEAAVGGPQ